MYTEQNFRTKKELREAVAASLAGTGKPVYYYQPGRYSETTFRDGTLDIEGPHYPEPHRWYAICVARDGAIVRVK